MSPKRKTKPKSNSKPKSADDYAAAIEKAWSNSIAGLVEAGKLLVEAKAALPHGDFIKMVDEKTPFGIRVAQRLMAIVNNEVLSNASNWSHLPTSLSALATLARLSPEKLKYHIGYGKVTPITTAAEARRLTVDSRLVRLKQAIGLIAELSQMDRYTKYVDDSDDNSDQVVDVDRVVEDVMRQLEPEERAWVFQLREASAWLSAITEPLVKAAGVEYGNEHHDDDWDDEESSFVLYDEPVDRPPATESKSLLPEQEPQKDAA